ncbi:MAG: type II toxin-antitoxin system HicB family antitoxin [Pseudomonadales bacterium]|jgi:predicted RNase H-like HicB family nuclease|nr:type II toxin-antitoxin system HicB family antitoxin [Pseudomonadales bacterium]
MKFPIAIEPGSDTTAWGVVVPDLPGCFSAGDTAEEAFINAAEAIELHLETLAEDNGAIPTPRSIGHWQSDPEFAGWVWALVEVDINRFDGRAEKINITVPRRLLARIDEYARTHGATRSGFLADAARAAMER